MRNIATFTDCVSLTTRLQEQSSDMFTECQILVLSEQHIPIESGPLSTAPAAQTEQTIQQVPSLHSLGTAKQSKQIAQKSSSRVRVCPLSQYTSLLGQEFDIVIYDLSAGFRASAFLVLSGLVRGDGWLFLTNTNEAFSGLTFSFDPDNVATSVSSNHDSELANSFCSDNSTDHDVINDNHASKYPSYLLQQLLANIPTHIDKLPDNFISRIGQAGFITAWQIHQHNAAAVQQSIRAQIVESILQNNDKTILNSDEVSHHVVTAPRGRGKSYLLGQIISDLQVRLPAVNIGVLTQNRKQIAPLLEQTKQIDTLPPDADFNTYPLFDILVIDEAASFPVELLQHYRNHAKHLIYGTTTHGYEGTGMGFTHKYLPKVSRTDTVRQYYLEQPFRFISPCPIEQVCDVVLFNNHADTNRNVVRDTDTKLPQCIEYTNEPLNYTDGTHWLAPSELRENTQHARSTVAALMQLLSLAHYQTTPDDLQRIIDSNDMQCLIYIENKRLIGCVWLIEEGLANCEHSLKQAILAGIRRVPGHLTVQQLAHGYHIPEILEWHVWRVNRIAVLPDKQHKGIGSLLMQTVTQYAFSQSIDALTSSFGAEQDLVSFWQKQGFSIWKEGQKANKVTGYHNCIVGLTLNTDNNKNANQNPSMCLDGDASSDHEKQVIDKLLEKHYILAKQWHSLLQKQKLKGKNDFHFLNTDNLTESNPNCLAESNPNSSAESNPNSLTESNPNSLAELSTNHLMDNTSPLSYELHSSQVNDSHFIQTQLDIIYQFINGSRSINNAEASIFWFVSNVMKDGHLSVEEESTHAPKWLEKKTSQNNPEYFNINELLLARYQHGYSIKECCTKYKIQGKKMFGEWVAKHLKVLLLNALKN